MLTRSQVNAKLTRVNVELTLDAERGSVMAKDKKKKDKKGKKSKKK